MHLGPADLRVFLNELRRRRGGPFGTRGAPFADYAFTPAAPEKESDGDFNVVGMR